MGKLRLVYIAEKGFKPIDSSGWAEGSTLIQSVPSWVNLISILLCISGVYLAPLLVLAVHIFEAAFLF